MNSISVFTHLIRVKEESVPLIEAIRQLKDNGIIKEHPTGGYVVETTQDSIGFSLPKELKKNDLSNCGLKTIVFGSIRN